MLASEDQSRDRPQDVPDLGALSAQASALTAACSLRELLAALDQLRTGIAALDTASLVPRRGLAGLFDSRARRLKAFRTAYRAAAGRISDLADDLSRGAGSLAARHEALSGLWADLREVVVTLDRQDAHRDADRPVVPPATQVEAAPTEPGTTERLEGQSEEAQPITMRAVALGGLAALRAARNAEHHVPARLLEVREGVVAWQAEWQHALGLSAAKARRLRPDVVRLNQARSTLLDLVARAEGGLEAALARKDELAKRAPMRRSPVEAL